MNSTKVHSPSSIHPCFSEFFLRSDFLLASMQSTHFSSRQSFLNRLIWYIGQALTLNGSPKSNYIKSILPLVSLITAILTKMTQEGGRQDISLSKRGAVLPASCSVCPYGHQDDMGNRQSLARKDFICSQISYKRSAKAAFCCCFSLW